MSYRHAPHAGNFADVLKHAVVAHCVRHMTEQDKPFAALDTHAGAGSYALDGEAADPAAEWRGGIGRLWTATPPEAAAAFLAPYVAAIRSHNDGERLARYPGSPAILLEHARPADRVVLAEVQPDDARALALRFEDDVRSRVIESDGYLMLRGLVPPKERRGIALVDPSFEEREEMMRMGKAAKDAIARWPGGTYIFWRPLTDPEAAERFDVGLASWLVNERAFAPEQVLRADLSVRGPQDGGGPLVAAGVVVVNPPPGLQEGLLATLPWVADTLRQDEGAGWRVDRPAAAEEGGGGSQ